MATCAKCDEEISEEADRCSHCGYEPAAELGEEATTQLAYGIGCLIFIITIPLAPLFFIGWWTKRRKAKKATPTALPH